MKCNVKFAEEHDSIKVHSCNRHFSTRTNSKKVCLHMLPSDNFHIPRGSATFTTQKLARDMKLPFLSRLNKRPQKFRQLPIAPINLLNFCLKVNFFCITSAKSEKQMAIGTFVPKGSTNSGLLTLSYRNLSRQETDCSYSFFNNH